MDIKSQIQIPQNPPSPYIKNQILSEEQKKKSGGTGEPRGFLPFLEEQVDEDLPPTDEQKLVQWGMDGPKSFNFPCRISQIEASGAHVLALTSSGNVYVWGRQGSDAPVLGFGLAVVEARFPKLLPSLQKIKSIGCGELTSAAITQTGQLYIWGDPFLAKSHVNQQPSLFLPLKDEKVSKVAFGDRHAIAIIHKGGPLPEDTQLVSWGYAKEGVLGHTEFKNIDLPQPPIPISGLDGKRVIDVSIGKRHCACCNVEGKVWMWGNNRQQQSPVLGTRDRSPILWIPHLALFPCHRVETPRVLRVYCGNSITFAHTDKGKLYSWGSDQYCKGALGLGPECSYTPFPTLVPPAVKGQKIAHMGVGGEHVMTSSTTGTLSAFGTGKAGQLKIAGKEVLSQPTKVPLKNQVMVLDVSCNFRNVFTVSVPDKAKLVCGKQQEIFSVQWHRKLDHLVSYISDRYQDEVPAPFLLFDEGGKKISNSNILEVVTDMHCRGLSPVFYAVSISTIMEKEEGEQVIFDKKAGCLSTIHKKNMFQALSGSLINSLLCPQKTDLENGSSFLHLPIIRPELSPLELQDGLLFFAPFLFGGISAHCILDRLISLYCSFSPILEEKSGKKPFDLKFWKPFFVKERGEGNGDRSRIVPETQEDRVGADVKESCFWVIERQNRILAVFDIWFERFPLDFCLKSIKSEGEGEKYLVQKLLDFLSWEEHQRGTNWEEVTKLRHKVMLRISVIKQNYCENQGMSGDIEEGRGDGRRRRWGGEEDQEEEEEDLSEQSVEEGNFLLEMDSQDEFQEHEQKDEGEQEGENGENQEDESTDVHQRDKELDREQQEKQIEQEHRLFFLENEKNQHEKKEEEKKVEEQEQATLDRGQHHHIFYERAKQLFGDREMELLLSEGGEDVELLACHPETLACQLTMFDTEFILRSISPREIIEWYCKKKTDQGEEEKAFGGEANCLGLKRAIARLARVTDWIEKEIVCCSQERRIAVVCVALETARQLMNLKNYFSFGCFYLAFQRHSVQFVTQNVWTTGIGLSPDFKTFLEGMRACTQNGLFSSEFLTYFAKLPLPKIPFYPVYLVLNQGTIPKDTEGHGKRSPREEKRKGVLLGISREKEREEDKKKEEQKIEKIDWNRGEESVGDEVVIWNEMRWMSQLSLWLNSFSNSSFGGQAKSNLFLRNMWTLRGFHYSPFIHSQSMERVVCHMRSNERKGEQKHDPSKVAEFDLKMFSVILENLVDAQHPITDRWFLSPDTKIFDARNQIFSTLTAMALSQQEAGSRLTLWRDWEERLKQESNQKAFALRDQSAFLCSVFFPLRSILLNSNGFDLALLDLIENPVSPSELPVIHSTLSLFWGGEIDGREVARALSSLNQYQLSELDKHHLQNAVQMMKRVRGLVGDWAIAENEFVNTLLFLLNDVELVVRKLKECEKITPPKSLLAIQSNLKAFVPITGIPSKSAEEILWLLFCWSFEHLHWFTTSNFSSFPEIQDGILCAKKSVQSLVQTIMLSDINHDLSQKQKELEWVTSLQKQLDQDEEAFECSLSQWEDSFTLDNEQPPSLSLAPNSVEHPPVGGGECGVHQSLDELIENLHQLSQESQTKTTIPFIHFAEKGFQEFVFRVTKSTTNVELLEKKLEHFVKLLGRMVVTDLLLKMEDDFLKSTRFEIFSTVERLVGMIEKKYDLTIQHRLKTSLANIINQLPEEKILELIKK